MPKMDVDTYMEYLEIRDDIMGTERRTDCIQPRSSER